jgi:hypothetical protein
MSMSLICINTAGGRQLRGGPVAPARRRRRPLHAGVRAEHGRPTRCVCVTQIGTVRQIGSWQTQTHNAETDRQTDARACVYYKKKINDRQ